ncbi:LiaF transmembrane domain-containing protein [Paenibacillus glufosinatiresistens]|uniref:LiaF transmembrane domain-containing protein n=1 Tax=Paenibacillus glufosinatiresistens TaxID=3070657 RepID=UPI00286DB4D5|nr:hypothetical protein [Paenibacillus sp. YX.27]
MDKRTLWGLLLVILGVLLFAGRGDIMEPGRVFTYFWPSLFVIPLGILMHWLYFYATRRRGSGLLIPGGILLVSGIIFQISMLLDAWEYTWPGFPLAVAFGLLEFYWFGGRNRWILIPVFILGGASLTFFMIFTVGTLLSVSVLGQSVGAVLLVAAGLALMMGRRRGERY